MGGVDRLRNPLQVVVRRMNDRVVVMLFQDQTTKRIFLKVKESAGALDIGQAFRRRCRQGLVESPTHQAITEVPDQFLMVPLNDSEEVYDLATEVIENLHF